MTCEDDDSVFGFECIMNIWLTTKNRVFCSFFVIRNKKNEAYDKVLNLQCASFFHYTKVANIDIKKVV